MSCSHCSGSVDCQNIQVDSRLFFFTYRYTLDIPHTDSRTADGKVVSKCLACNCYLTVEHILQLGNGIMMLRICKTSVQRDHYFRHVCFLVGNRAISENINITYSKLIMDQQAMLNLQYFNIP